MKKAIDGLKAQHKAIRHSLRSAIASAPPELVRPAKKLLIGSLSLVILVSAGKYAWFAREKAARELEIALGPKLKTALITQSSGEHATTVIGEARAYQSVTLYAKVSGYLKAIKVDKGDMVKKGQVLAVIESPETDQAYAAALSNSRNKQDISSRMSTLLNQGLVSPQEAGQALSDGEVAAAQLRAQEILKGYEIIRAPFDGTVTARFADPGALVQNATNSQASALPLVTVSQIDRLRVDIFLDQRDAPFVRKDDPVEITLTERSEFKLLGQVSRVSDQLDPRTKMMMTEIDILNADRKLVAGSFVQVSLKVKSVPYFEVPVEALVLKDNKSFLTIITAEQNLSYRQVDLAGNNGKILWVLKGVEKGEMVAINAGTSVPEGGKVRPIIEEIKDGKDGKDRKDSKESKGAKAP
jgi:RND family efflux transporter MFP subunit